MTKQLTIIASALAILGMVSCSKDYSCSSCPDAGNRTEQSMDEGVLKVSMVFPEDAPQTRALSAYTTVQPYEKAVNKVQLLVFDEGGRLNAYRNLGTGTSSSITTTVGQKKLWAVVNGPDLSSVSSESTLKAKTVSLTDNSTSAATGFVMSGSSTCNLTTSGASASVTVSRLTGRIALVGVKNSLPSVYPTLTVKKVYAINVAGTQNLACDASQSASLNVGSDKGEAATLLTKTVSKAVTNGSSYAPTTPDLFYAYPNNSSRKTRLVVETEIAGKTYYYPVTMATLERNKAYTVSVNILNLGSDDPDKPVEKGSITATVSIAGWESGANYEESI